MAAKRKSNSKCGYFCKETNMKKIVIIGPESTGKSTLCEQLALHYDTVWCPEYARYYLEESGMDYTYEDLNKIAQGQLALEESMEEDVSNDLYFVDTDMYVMKVWFEVAFQHCPTWILKGDFKPNFHDIHICVN